MADRPSGLAGLISGIGATVTIVCGAWLLLRSFDDDPQIPLPPSLDRNGDNRIDDDVHDIFSERERFLRRIGFVAASELQTVPEGITQAFRLSPADAYDCSADGGPRCRVWSDRGPGVEQDFWYAAVQDPMDCAYVCQPSGPAAGLEEDQHYQLSVEGEVIGYRIPSRRIDLHE